MKIKTQHNLLDVIGLFVSLAVALILYVIAAGAR